MNQFKKIASACFLLLIVLMTGCEKNEPEISTADRDKFIGTWSGSSTGPGGPRSFNMLIKASNSAPDQVLLEEFDGLAAGSFLNASVSGNSITIITTSVSGETYSGSGTLSGSTISFTFSIDDGQTIENRTASVHK